MAPCGQNFGNCAGAIRHVKVRSPKAARRTAAWHFITPQLRKWDEQASRRFETGCRRCQERTEQTLERGATIAFTSGTALTLGYCNERFGSAPADDPSGYKEMTVLKMPVDIVAGGLMTRRPLLGAFGKYDHFEADRQEGMTPSDIAWARSSREGT